MLLRKILESANFEVQEAANGMQGVELFKQWPPDLVFMDMRMQVMDGYQSTAITKATDHGKVCVVIALTASAFEEQRASILACGCDDLLHKPCTDIEIFSIIAKYLNVQYVYDEQPEKRGELETTTQLKPKDFTGVSKAWCKKLLQTAKQADGEQLKVLVESLSDKQASLRYGLQQLIDDYRFDKISQLLEQVLDKWSD